MCVSWFRNISIYSFPPSHILKVIFVLTNANKSTKLNSKSDSFLLTVNLSRGENRVYWKPKLDISVSVETNNLSRVDIILGSGGYSALGSSNVWVLNLKDDDREMLTIELSYNYALSAFGRLGIACTGQKYVTNSLSKQKHRASSVSTVVIQFVTKNTYGERQTYCIRFETYIN